MATHTVTTLIDDLDGSEATQTVAFAYRGTNYTIDLNDKNAAAFDKAVGKYTTRGTKDTTRKTSSGRTGTPATRGGAKRSDLADIRAWATDQGYEVSTRGRIAADIVEAYDAAH